MNKIKCMDRTKGISFELETDEDVDKMMEYIEGVVRPEVKEREKKGKKDQLYENCVNKIPPGLTSSHLAQVDYKELPDSNGDVEITGLRNFYSSQEIKTKYGTEVYNQYFYGYNSNVWMTRNMDSSASVIYYSYGWLFEIGKVYHHNDFMDKIEFARKCGKRLGDIISKTKTKAIVTKIITI